jgi:RHS repeat-associated protein
VTVTVIPTNNAYGYGLNSNLLSDGTRNFAYDDENQSIAVWQVNAWSNNFVYDGKMRRRIERDFTWNNVSSAWQQTNEIHFIYDGNLVIQERDINNQPQVTYTRGIDLSGTLQAAGGIGGLLARTDRAQVIPGLVSTGFGTSSYYHADGNGNVTMLIDGGQMIVAKYLYDPFGNMLAKYGLLADVNNYRFSSKEWNGNSGLYYYLYRFYDPNLQRWVNRDPFREIGFEITHRLLAKRMHIRSGAAELAQGPDLYEFVRNSPSIIVDVRGLQYAGGFPVPQGGGPVWPEGNNGPNNTDPEDGGPESDDNIFVNWYNFIPIGPIGYYGSMPILWMLNQQNNDLSGGDFSLPLPGTSCYAQAANSPLSPFYPLGSPNNPYQNPDPFETAISNSPYY